MPPDLTATKNLVRSPISGPTSTKGRNTQTKNLLRSGLIDVIMATPSEQTLFFVAGLVRIKIKQLVDVQYNSLDRTGTNAGTTTSRGSRAAGSAPGSGVGGRGSGVGVGGRGSGVGGRGSEVGVVGRGSRCMQDNRAIL